MAPQFSVPSVCGLAFLPLCEWKVDTVYEITEFGDVEGLSRVSVQRLKFAFGEVSNARLCLVLCIDKRKALSSLNGLYFPTYSDPLAVSEHPPATMPRDVTSLLGSSHSSPFALVHSKTLAGITCFRQGESRQANPTAISANLTVNRKGFRQGSLIPFISATASRYALAHCLAYFGPRLTGRAHVGNLRRTDDHTRTAQRPTLRSGMGYTGPDSLDNQALLEFGHCADDVELKPTSRRAQV